jgi:pyruvate, orthophosphate dikinase
VRSETTPDDSHGIIAAQGILTSRGGMTSHAAVVARGMGKPCVCGCDDLEIDFGKKTFCFRGVEHPEGVVLSIDGSTGRVFPGEVPLIDPDFSPEYFELLEWADQKRRLKVRANADTPDDARRAVEMGAQGIGLCRTEHMFMAADRVPVVQRMILSPDLAAREAALNELLPMQQADFTGIFREMAGYPVTVRLLDPPLHEFLPDRDDLLVEVYRLSCAGDPDGTLKEKENLLKKINALSEFNPMLGHRGCRLGLVYPEIYRMQVRAIFLALFDLIDEGLEIRKLLPEIMIPLVGHRTEIEIMKRLVDETAAAVFAEKGKKIDYLVGTMIELPRACLVAGQLAEVAAFFSFGTNDLTQTTLGYSRDDSEGKFLPFYLQNKILETNPFAEFDCEGVGRLVKMAVDEGKAVKNNLKVGVCGEHGGDPASISFFNRIGLDYVSCSPFRLPVARLAAARAMLDG